jgi:hypothetical protein
MLVNITGKGRIPFIHVLAPVYGYDISEQHAKALVTQWRNFPMYEAESGVMVLPNNVHKLFNHESKIMKEIWGQKPEPETIELKINTVYEVKEHIIEEETVIEEDIPEEKEGGPISEKESKEVAEVVPEESPVQEDTITQGLDMAEPSVEEKQVEEKQVEEKPKQRPNNQRKPNNNRNRPNNKKR